MTFPPIVDRELRLAARLPATYRNRMLAAGAVGLVAVMMLVVGAFTNSPSQVGGTMFATLSYLSLAFCLLEGARKTADCLSMERREGTLGLLFLTDLRGYDVVFGKLAAASLASIYGLLAILPILALALTLGGVTAGEFWRMALALTNILFFSLAAGMFISAHSQTERSALAGTLGLVIALLLGPSLTTLDNLASLSPGHAFNGAFEATYNGHPAGYWESLGLTQLLAWCLLAWASFRVSRFRQDEPVPLKRSTGLRAPVRRRPQSAEQRAKTRGQLLEINPILWLAARDAGRPVLLWLLLAIMAGFLIWCLVGLVALSKGQFADFGPALFPLAVVLNFLVKVQVAAQSCHFLAEARANQSLELLLSTPLTLKEVTEGQSLALKRIFLRPVVALLSLEIIAGLCLVSRTDVPTIILGCLAFSPFYLFIFVADMWAICWAGMWFGLSSRSESLAIFKTVGYVLLLPLAAGIFSCFAYPFFVAWPIICWSWAADKVQRECRRLAGQRFTGPQESANWWSLRKRTYRRG